MFLGQAAGLTVSSTDRSIDRSIDIILYFHTHRANQLSAIFLCNRSIDRWMDRSIDRWIDQSIDRSIAQKYSRKLICSVCVKSKGWYQYGFGRRGFCDVLLGRFVRLTLSYVCVCLCGYLAALSCIFTGVAAWTFWCWSLARRTLWQTSSRRWVGQGIRLFLVEIIVIFLSFVIVDRI